MSTTVWWERRRHGEPTADYLARVLDEMGAAPLASRALAYHFDDYQCPADVDDGANMQRLVTAVRDWSRSSTRAQRDRAKVVIDAVMNGEFDGTRDEAQAWAASPDGQATFAELLGGSPRNPRATGATS